MADQIGHWWVGGGGGAIYSEAGHVPQRDLTVAEWERYKLEGTRAAMHWSQVEPPPPVEPDSSEENDNGV